MKRILFTYSDGAVDRAKELLQEMLDLMSSPLTPDDLFYFGVFSNVYQYANNIEMNLEIENIPAILINEMAPLGERMNYVQTLIDNIMTGKEKKPQWMIDIEQDERCDVNGKCSPSTQLYLYPKDEKYRELGEAMIRFLYSLGHEIGCQIED